MGTPESMGLRSRSIYESPREKEKYESKYKDEEEFGIRAEEAAYNFLNQLPDVEVERHPYDDEVKGVDFTVKIDDNEIPVQFTTQYNPLEKFGDWEDFSKSELQEIIKNRLTQEERKKVKDFFQKKKRAEEEDNAVFMYVKGSSFDSAYREYEKWREGNGKQEGKTVLDFMEGPQKRRILEGFTRFMKPSLRDKVLQSLGAKAELVK